jgi:outer membrane protein TolC
MIRKYVLPVLAIAGAAFAVATVVRGNQPKPIAEPMAQPARAPFEVFVAGAGIIEAGGPCSRIPGSTRWSIGPSERTSTCSAPKPACEKLGPTASSPRRRSGRRRPRPAPYQGELATDLDVARAEAQVESTASDIQTLEISSEQAIHRLGVLLGEPPGALAPELSASRPIPAAPSQLPAGLPSDLLRRRPDVRRSERQLAAATALIGVATADLYPKFSLVGSAGLESISASDFFTAGSKVWSFGPSITWPIFQGGRIVATIEVRNAEALQALLTYRQTVLAALEDAENAIVAYTRERDRRETLAEATHSNQRAVDHATSLYARGLTNFLNVLDAQRNLYQTQNDLAQSETTVSTELVALHKALGGGWDTVPMP